MGPTVVETLQQATEEVFATMVFRTLTSERPIEGDALRPQSNVVGTVGFVGSARGLVAFYSTLAGARDIACSMLGIEPANVNGEMADAIGEITNMIAGSFRTRMAAQGDTWAITVPTVTVGSDFYIKPHVQGRRVLIPFKMDGHEIFVELILMDKKNES